MENGVPGGVGNSNHTRSDMSKQLACLFCMGILEAFSAELLGEGGSSSHDSAEVFQATVSQIREPGVGTPNEAEIFVAIKSDGTLEAAKEKAMEDVRFQARNKGLSYEIIGITEERLGFGCRVKIQYRLKPVVIEVATPETTWWEEILTKIQSYLPYLKKVLVETESFVNTSLARSQKTETEGRKNP